MSRPAAGCRQRPAAPARAVKRGFALATALAAGAAESAEGVPPPWGRGTLVKRTPLAEQATQDRSIGQYWPYATTLFDYTAAPCRTTRPAR